MKISLGVFGFLTTVFLSSSLIIEASRQCGQTPLSTRERITNGEITGKNDFPFMVNILYPGCPGCPDVVHHKCGGTVINEWTVVTAAHCTDARLKCTMLHLLNLRFGDWDSYKYEVGQVERGVSQIIYHPDYVPFGMRYDVALIKLDRPLEFNDYVQPICLPSGPVTGGEHAVVMGWGDTMSDGMARYLNIVDSPIVDKELCKSKEWNGEEGDFVKEEMMCAGFEEGIWSSCGGDSGGPVARIVDGAYELTGIVSFGVVNCTQERKPGINVDVNYVKDWIAENAWTS